MISALRKQKTTYSSTANVVDGKLILSCPGAVSPVVWQMDMVEVKASALEVTEDKQAEPSAFVLMLRTLKDELVTIANFATKDEAVVTLLAVTGALQNAHGLIRPVTNSAQAGTQARAHPDKTGKSRWGSLVLALVILGGIFFMLSSFKTPIPAAPGSDADTAEEALQKAPENGVPLSAEEFLKNNK